MTRENFFTSGPSVDSSLLTKELELSQTRSDNQVSVQNSVLLLWVELIGDVLVCQVPINKF